MAKNERILIVDDDADLVEVIAEILSLYNYQVTTLTGLSGLKEALAENEFQLIITDLHLGRESGREIVEAIGRRERPIPVLIMTGFPENEEVKNLLYRDYVSGLLIKPFAESDIVSNVKLAIDNVHSVTHKKVAPFLAAPLSIIQVDTDLEFDVFLKIYEGKYVKIAHHNSRLTQDKVEALAAKKIQSIYIPYDQFPETLKQNIDYLRHSREQGKNLGARDKELLFMSGRPITETFRSLNLDESTFKSVEEYVGICLHFASKFELLFSDLREVQKNSPERYFRIISTMFLGCAYALLTEKFSKDEVLAIGLGSLLMNIGESQLSEALFVQSYATLSMAERRE
ncbi:MAG: response regulator, partial [Bdellovibrionales bacterium]|nr:response regulator [Bdellovibrionales bacterium]